MTSSFFLGNEDWPPSDNEETTFDEPETQTRWKKEKNIFWSSSTARSSFWIIAEKSRQLKTSSKVRAAFSCRSDNFGQVCSWKKIPVQVQSVFLLRWTCAAASEAAAAESRTNLTSSIVWQPSDRWSSSIWGPPFGARRLNLLGMFIISLTQFQHLRQVD